MCCSRSVLRLPSGPDGGVPERSNGAVLKTAAGDELAVGSNPTSAVLYRIAQS